MEQDVIALIINFGYFPLDQFHINIKLQIDWNTSVLKKKSLTWLKKNIYSVINFLD